MRGLGEKYSCLSSGISSTNDNDFFSTAQLRLEVCCAVIDARPLKLRQILQRKFSIHCAGGNNYGSSRHFLAIIKLQRIRPPVTS